MKLNEKDIIKWNKFHFSHDYLDWALATNHHALVLHCHTIHKHCTDSVLLLLITLLPIDLINYCLQIKRIAHCLSDINFGILDTEFGAQVICSSYATPPKMQKFYHFLFIFRWKRPNSILCIVILHFMRKDSS